MENEWSITTIGDVAKIKHGFAFKGEFFTDEVTPHVLVTPGNFAICGGFQIGKPKYYVGPLPADYALSEGEVVVTMTDLSKSSDTLGYAAKIPATSGVTYWHNQRIGLLQVIDKKRACKDWLHYLMRTHKYRAWVVGSASGTTVKHTSPSRIESFSFKLPPLAEQRAIAETLGALDDRIDNLRQTNATLEAIAAALFKSWFVDFDGVAQEDMQESELGLIPKGWEFRPVGDFAELKGGKQLAKEEIAETGSIPVFGGAGVMGYTTSHNAEGFVITVGRVGAYCGQFFAHRGKAYVNNNASLIRQLNEAQGEWLFLSLRNADIETIKKGAAQPFVSNGDIANMKIVWPGIAGVNEFSQIVGPLMRRAEQASDESRTLAQLRDTLLPRLISGQLRIGEAARLADEIA